MKRVERENKDPSKMEGVIALIPTYNEAETIDELVQDLEGLGCINWILVVDDSSTDGTLEKLEVLLGEYGNIFVHQRPRKLGLGTALRDGFRLALECFPFNRLIQMDGDMSHDPSLIPKMLGSDADAVLGSRYVNGGRIVGWNVHRKLLSHGANFIVRNLLGLGIRDATTGFRIYSRRAVEIIAEEAGCGNYEFQVEAIWLTKRHGLRIEEVPITFIERLHGESKLKGFHEAGRLTAFVLKQLF